MKYTEEAQESGPRDTKTTWDRVTDTCCDFYRVDLGEALRKYMRNDSPVKQRQSPKAVVAEKKSPQRRTSLWDPLRAGSPTSDGVDPADRDSSLNEKRYQLKDHVVLGRQLKRIEVQR